MGRRCRYLILGLLSLCLSWLLFSSLEAQASVSRYQIFPEPVAAVDDRLFGHFLERASWGEPGPEISLVPGTGQIYPAAVELMREMNIPILRFPGGTDVDYTDWRDLISNVPGRAPERPVTVGHLGGEITNRFGLDEYFQLRDTLGKSSGAPVPETILVTNFLDAVSGKVPLEQAALSAAGLVAYVNASLGQPLPSGMPDWPGVRAQNGHPQPYGVEYLQIGNELWSYNFQRLVREGTGLTEPAELAQWYLRCLRAYIAAIDAVDPTTELMVDGAMGQGIEQTVLADPAVRSRVRYAAFHDYAPGRTHQVRLDGEPYPRQRLSLADWWRAWVAMPGRFSEDGVNIAFGDRIALARSLGYDIAATEWNWNGWGFDNIDPEPTSWRLASGIGTAGFLNGLMRQAADVKLACQSMLVGAYWDITGIRVDPADEMPPYYLPQGQMTGFYSRHHGATLLRAEATNVPRYAQPYAMGWAGAPDHDVALIDLVATADEDRLYIHAINRAFDRALPVELDLAALPEVGKLARQYLYVAKPGDTSASEVAEILPQSLVVTNKKVSLMLPKQSVSIVEIART